MRSSCIRQPENEPLIILRKWQREACDGDNCAGMLLAFFEFKHNYKLEQAQKARQSNNIREAHGDERSQEETLLTHWTEEELEEALLHEYGRKRIREALLLLESKGFISIHPNPNPKYKMDKTRYFLFHPKTVNAWLSIHRPVVLEDGLLDEVKQPDADEAKLPHRKGKKAGGGDQKAVGAGQKGGAINKYDSQETITSNGEEDTSSASTELAVVMEWEQLETVEQLPQYLKPPSTVDDGIWVALIKVCAIPLFTKPTKQQAIGLNDVGTALTRGRKTARDVYEFERRWYEGWQGREGTPPTPRQMRENWGAMMARREVHQNGAQNGTATGGVSKLLQHQQQRRNVGR